MYTVSQFIYQQALFLDIIFWKMSSWCLSAPMLLSNLWTSLAILIGLSCDPTLLSVIVREYHLIMYLITFSNWMRVHSIHNIWVMWVAKDPNFSGSKYYFILRLVLYRIKTCTWGQHTHSLRSFVHYFWLVLVKISQNFLVFQRYLLFR